MNIQRERERERGGGVMQPLITPSMSRVHLLPYIAVKTSG